MLAREVDGDTMQQPQNLVHKWLRLAGLLHHEVAPALLRNLDEGIASHVLHTFVGFVHELEKFVNNRLEEFPVRFEEPWILPHNVHDV